MRMMKKLLLVMPLAALLTACQQVTGNEVGGVINGRMQSHNPWTDLLKGLGMPLMFDEDALQKASEHCSGYRKRARVTFSSWDKTLFECI
jgi:hypothetical protein